MRIMFGLAGILVVLAVVGLLGRRQLAVEVHPRHSASAPAPGSTVRSQAHETQQAYRQAVEGAMQPRPEPDPSDGK